MMDVKPSPKPALIDLPANGMHPLPAFTCDPALSAASVIRAESSASIEKSQDLRSSSAPSPTLPRKLFIPGCSRRVFRPTFSAAEEEKFQYLWKRLYQCDRYVKYRGGYEEGRDTKAKKNGKWPLEHEEAFFRAVVRFPPCGREHKNPAYRCGRPLPAGFDNPQLGRNELIALFINDWIGWFGYETKDELIGRKKVSSHLQVIKAFFKEIDSWVSWHLGHDIKKRPLEPKRCFGLNMGNAMRAFYETPPSFLITSAPTPMPGSLDVLGSQTNLSHSDATLQPHAFRMDIRDPICRSAKSNHNCSVNPHDCNLNTVHKISMLQECNRLAPRFLEEVRGWQGHFPHLAQLSQGRVPKCDVLFADSSLALNVEQFREGCNLTIENSFRTTQPGLARRHEWQCRTKIFENGELRELLDDVDGRTIAFEKGSIHELLEDTKPGRSDVKQIWCDDHDVSLLHVHLRSHYWVRKFQLLATRLRSAAAERSASLDERRGLGEKSLFRKAEDDMRNTIKGITIMQEIFIVDRSLPEQRKRVTITYWKFRQTQKDEIGLTTWRTYFPCPPAVAEQRHLTDFTPEIPIHEGLTAASDLGHSHLPKATIILPSQSSYESTSSQHDVDLLTSGMLFDPTVYGFEIVNIKPENQSEIHSMSSSEPTVAGTDFSQPFSFDNATSFEMPIEAASHPDVTSVHLSNTFHDYETVVAGDAHDTYWSQEHDVHSTALSMEHTYVLTQTTHDLSQIGQEHSRGQDRTENQRHHAVSNTTEHLLPTQSHQHAPHHCADVDAMLDQGAILDQWNTQPLEQHYHFHPDEYLAQQHDDVDFIETSLHQSTHNAHCTLQDVQQEQERRLRQQYLRERQARQLQQLIHGPSRNPAAGLKPEQSIESEAELDWDVIMAVDYNDAASTNAVVTGADATSPGIALELAQPQPRKLGLKLLPSALEN